MATNAQGYVWHNIEAGERGTKSKHQYRQMQNTVTRTDERGKSHDVVIFRENTDFSGFVIREMLETKNPEMTFQAGYLVSRPMRLPIYTGATVSSHKEGDEILKFLLHGNGRTKEEAITRASNKLLRRDIEKQTRGALV